ncbi:MAG: hypothetical protein QM764_02180 [Chitinophagaceae bacterium]
MKLESAVKKKIIRDILVSIVLYVLPVVLMFLTFYINGQRPWLEKTTKTEAKK